MKITVSIEVSNVEELSQVAEALKNGGLEVEGATETDGEETEVTEAPKRTAKKASKKAPAKKAAPAEVAPVKAPSEPLVMAPSQGVPPVIEQAPAQPAQQVTPAPMNAQAVQGAAVPGFDALGMIQDAAGRLGAFTGMDQAAKQDVIASTLAQVGAPQGVRGSELPEPHLSRFAQALNARVNQILSAPGQGPLV